MAFEAENYGYHPQYITEQIRKGTTDLNLSHLLDRDILNYRVVKSNCWLVPQLKFVNMTSLY